MAEASAGPELVPCEPEGEDPPAGGWPNPPDGTPPEPPPGCEPEPLPGPEPKPLPGPEPKPLPGRAGAWAGVKPPAAACTGAANGIANEPPGRAGHQQRGHATGGQQAKASPTAPGPGVRPAWPWPSGRARRGRRWRPICPGTARLAIARPGIARPVRRRRRGRGLSWPVAAPGALLRMPRHPAWILVFARPGYGLCASFTGHGHMVGQRTSASDESHLWVCQKAARPTSRAAGRCL